MQISLAPGGDLRLTYPSGRSVDVPNSPHAIGYLYSLLYNVQEAERSAKRASYPTQHDVDKFIKNQARERKEQVFKDHGIDMAEITINI